MEEDIYTFEDLLALLPEGWQAKAKELGAFERAREVKSPKDLLRLIFLYLSEGRSFAGTSAPVFYAKRCQAPFFWIKIYRMVSVTLP
jgi:hypothetical protein